MNWSNYLHLLVGIASGLALGMSFCWLFGKSKTGKTGSSSAADQYDDVCALQQQRKQTELAYQMAQEMSQFKGGFLARTSHVLRSPLNGLIGLHQLILSDLCENPAEEREFIAQAHERALKLVKLLDEILRVARTDYGTHKLDIQPLPLASLLQEVYQLGYMLAENRSFQFLLELPNPELHVLADSHWLRQVLLSLVDTTVAGMEQGSIIVSTQTSPKNHMVQIWLDIPSHAIAKSEPIDLFESLESSYQPGTDTENNPVLPGMKLLMNQTLLEAMGGRLELVSLPTADEAEQEQKTRLQVSIPLGIPEAELPQSQQKQFEVDFVAP
ncbi:MAG: HAMP domain-containing sensor histidine kinase [Nostocaceae cyanobacterium]|nr:HAMP domain-containing sensor histidine kinase [Nostocaceae cyanobacterium]